MTREQINRLPLIVTRQVFLEVTGLSRHDLWELVRAGKVRVFRPPGRKHSRYYREDMIKVAEGVVA